MFRRAGQSVANRGIPSAQARAPLRAWSTVTDAAAQGVASRIRRAQVWVPLRAQSTVVIDGVINDGSQMRGEDAWKALKKRQSLLKTHCREVLEQKKVLLEMVSDEDYVKRIPAFFDAAISAHVRHSLQHIQRVLSLVGSHEEDATTLTYDDRERKNDVEKSRAKAIKLTDKMIGILDGMQSEDFVLPVHAEFVASASTGKKYAVESNIERELSFVAHHATHHLALINLMLKSEGYAVQKDIGLANSTRLHHETMLNRER